MTEPGVLQDDRLIRRINATLGGWLRQEDWQPQQLIDWLEGHKLQRVGYEDEPYVWILRGLPLGDERCWAETRLAQRVATVLEDEPDVKKPGKRPEQVLFNLFMLCAGLNCPDELNKPLRQVLGRKALKGEWLGVDLRYTLQGALTWNQLDRHLESVWDAMLSGKGHDFLPGDEYVGFDGILQMPESEATRGEPYLAAIGRALGAMALLLEGETDRTLEFAALIEKVTNTHPLRPDDWDVRLALEAEKNAWPAWAKRYLVEVGDSESIEIILGNLDTIPDQYKAYACEMIVRSPYPGARAAAKVSGYATRYVIAGAGKPFDTRRYWASFGLSF